MPTVESASKWWKTSDTSLDTICYTNLVEPMNAQRGSDCARQNESVLAPRLHRLSRPQVSLYSVPASQNDPFRFERVIQARIDKGTNWAPGNQMLWTRVIIQPINFSFAVNVLIPSNYDTVVTKVETSNSSKLGADIEATLPTSLGPKAGLDANTAHSTKTSFERKASEETFGVDIRPGVLQIVSESGSSGSAVSNAPVPVRLVTDPHIIRSQSC